MVYPPMVSRVARRRAAIWPVLKVAMRWIAAFSGSTVISRVHSKCRGVANALLACLKIPAPWIGAAWVFVSKKTLLILKAENRTHRFPAGALPRGLSDDPLLLPSAATAVKAMG